MLRRGATLLTSAAAGGSSVGNPPAVAPGVVRSLYRMLLREVRKIDESPLSKTLFPLTVDLQHLTKSHGPLYFPNGQKYMDILREVFHDAATPPKVNLAFETLTRLRSHNERVTSRLSVFEKDRMHLINTMEASQPDKGLYRVERAPYNVNATSYRLPVGGGPSSLHSKLKIRQGYAVELEEAVALVAHPLSSTHMDRRVILIYEKGPHFTTGVVLDMLFTYPLSHGNPMFPEVFWGHKVYDGGVSQINFTMPPTAHISILHTLEPPTEPESPQYLAWLKWKDVKSKSRNTETTAEHPRLLCKPLIRGGVLDDGTVEPTLYLSKVEALPYLAQLVPGKPRSSARVYWGNMRWPTRQLEAEVANGHWIPVKLSPTFFGPFPLMAESGRADMFPTVAELKGMKETRERRYGVDVSLPQVFPPDRILRRRECLWDQIMYCLGGEYRSLVGCFNPFLESTQGVLPYDLPSPPSVVGCGLSDTEESVMMMEDLIDDAVERGAGEEAESGNYEEDLPFSAQMLGVTEVQGEEQLAKGERPPGSEKESDNEDDDKKKS
ncbi:hypothetical protein DPX39_110090900 [Trypanosoma brucei equiperdum]|uniref:Uncharacterized protein n=1 Tax=Trypanosoma brucei equiperdum TaxID=630700 RepID=A0A3L6KWU0_9TRYP|nr:hypothetical protein DPX39_110090900 [Trypanosoma brucei equiperdum]